MRTHKYYDVEVSVSYRMKVTVLASDEDDAVMAAEAEAQDEIPQNAYRVGIDCEDLTLNYDGDDYNED